MYAAGRGSPWREPCRRLLNDLIGGSRDLAACTNAEVLQEILHRYRSLFQPEIGFGLVDSVVQLGIPILPITDGDVIEARRLLESYPELDTRDAVHLGVMRKHDIEEVFSYDSGFSVVPWVTRREP